MTTGTAGRNISKVSVEQPLWRALTAFRVLALAYAVAGYAHVFRQYAHPAVAWAYLAALALWTLLTVRRVSSARRCTRGFLIADLAFGLAGILLTMVVDTHLRVVSGQSTLPGIWTAGSVLAFAIKGGWRWSAVASAIVGVSNVVERGKVAQGNVHSIVLLVFVSTGIGYVVEVARSSERTLTRALQIEAATRERERLARDIHDNVLQVLAMVQRRGSEIGGEAAELGRMAGEQEGALRALVLGGQIPVPRAAADPWPTAEPPTRTPNATCGSPCADTPAHASRCPPPPSPSCSRRTPPTSSPPRSAPRWTTSTGTRVPAPTPGSSSRTNPARCW